MRMSFGTIVRTKAKMSKREKNLVNYIEQLRAQMDTPYRMRAIELAAFATREYEGVSRSRVSNQDLMNVQLSFPIVNQRLSDLFNNPSRADYRTIDEDKENYIEVIKQVVEYDKQVGRHNSKYQDLQRIANIEGSAFFAMRWNEEMDVDGNTVGIPSTSLDRIRMNDMYWDISAKTISDMNHGIRRRVYSQEEFLRLYLPLKGYMNISAVIPGTKDDMAGSVYQEEWEEEGRDQGDTVTVWEFESKAFLEDGKLTTKRVEIANGILIFESKELPTPKVNGRNLLSWSKIDGVPTGLMVGLGIPIIIRHPQEAFSRLLTISVAAAELAGSPPLMVRAGADQDIDDYPVFPGNVIPIRGSGKSIGEDYQYLQIPDIGQGAQKIMQDIIEYVTMLTGVDIRALFVAAGEKAITTENKRQVQQKLLRFSVQWNEEHGFYDMELKRLALIQKWYPIRRTFIREDFEGRRRVEKDFLTVPLKDFEIISDTSKKKIKLNFRKGGYTQMKITPETLRFNVDLTIEGSSTAGERDIIEERNFIENMQIILSVPAFAEKFQAEPDKPLKILLDKMHIPEDEIFNKPSVRGNKMHPALKELASIQLMDVLTAKGIKIPEIFNDMLPEDYEPLEFVEIYNEFSKSDQWKKLNAKQGKVFTERLEFHNDNTVNPYFADLREKEMEEKKKQEIQEQQELANPEAVNVPVPKKRPEEGSLTSEVRKKAGNLAAAVRP